MEKIDPNEIFNIFTKEDDKKLTLKELAESLNLSVEDLYDMSLEDIEEFSVKMAKQKSEKMQNLLDKRNVAYTQTRNAQRDAGITNSDLSKLYFEKLKRGE